MRKYVSTKETRERILDEAEKLFRDTGSAKTTMGDVAKACGYSPSNIHRVFKTKSAINEAIAARFMNRVEVAISHAVESAETPSEKMHAFLNTLFDETSNMFIDNSNIYQMVIQAAEENWLSVRSYQARLQFFIKEILQTYGGTKVFGPDLDRIVQAIFSASTRLFHPIMVADLYRFETGEEIDALIDFIVKSVELQVEQACNTGAANSLP